MISELSTTAAAKVKDAVLSPADGLTAKLSSTDFSLLEFLPSGFL